MIITSGMIMNEIKELTFTFTEMLQEEIFSLFVFYSTIR